jgi:septum formation topological specificity factor MinE
MHEWITQKKQRAAMMYAQEVKEIVETYAQVDPESLRLAYERGDIADEPNPAGSGIRKLSIHNYVKAGDSVTMAINQTDNEIQTLEVSSYLTDPKEPVHILAEFVNARDGLNHVDAITATLPKRNFSVVIRNLTYEHSFQHVPH